MNIFVGKLNYQATNEDLQRLFSEFGTVKSAKVLNDNYTGRSRGFGFVEIENDDEARAAIKELDGTSFMQHTIVVNEAKPKESSFGGDRRDSFSRDKRRF